MFPFAVRDLKVPLCFPPQRLPITPPAKATLSPQLIFPRRPWVRLQQSQTLTSDHIPCCMCDSYTLTCHLPCPLWQLVSGSGDQLWCTMSHIWSCWWWSDLTSSRFTSRTRSDTCSPTSTSWVWDGNAQTQVLFQTPHTIVFYCIKSHSEVSKWNLFFVQSPTSHFRLDARARVKTGCSGKLPHIQCMHQNMLPIAPCGMLFFFVCIKPLLITMVIGPLL